MSESGSIHVSAKALMSQLVVQREKCLITLLINKAPVHNAGRVPAHVQS
jgi:hypothetical protein